MTRVFERARFEEPGLGKTHQVVDVLKGMASPLVSDRDLDPLMHRIGDARYVLLGEASHGTSEFYTWRARISERLIREKGFSFIAVEGDWPDAYRLNRYVKGRPGRRSAREVLDRFARWPTWMWANREVVNLVEWIRELGEDRPEDHKVGWYGLDVYSLWSSMTAVIGYLDECDVEAAREARHAYECFAPYFEDERAYARATVLVPHGCQEEVVRVLSTLVAKAPRYARDTGREAQFDAEQNALVAKNAELYYRSMVGGGAASWNVRDGHMAETLERLMQFHGPGAKCIVWEHNTHIGDARFTDMTNRGEYNVGQLVRESHPKDDVVLVGFSTHHGTVIAGEEWDAPMERMVVPPARPGSVEDTLHRVSGEDCLVIFGEPASHPLLLEPRGHRAIGVVYRPRYERFGNYVPTVLPCRYDALLHIDESHALAPLHAERPDSRVPETYPTGM